MCNADVSGSAMPYSVVAMWLLDPVYNLASYSNNADKFSDSSSPAGMIAILVSHDDTLSGVAPKQVDFSRPSINSLTVPSPPTTANLQATETSSSTTTSALSVLLPVIAVQIDLLDEF